MKPITDNDMLVCIARELKMRKRVYKSNVAKGFMDPLDAEWELQTMQAVYNFIAERTGAAVNLELPLE